MQIRDPNGLKGTLITGQIFTGTKRYMVSPELPDLEGMGIGFATSPTIPPLIATQTGRSIAR